MNPLIEPSLPEVVGIVFFDWIARGFPLSMGVIPEGEES